MSATLMESNLHLGFQIVKHGAYRYNGAYRHNVHMHFDTVSMRARPRQRKLDKIADRGKVKEIG